MKSAVLAAALAALSLGATAAPITALAQIDLSPPTIPVSAAEAYRILPEPLPEPLSQRLAAAPAEPASLRFDGSVPQLRTPAGEAMVELAEPPAILSMLGGLAVTLIFKRRSRPRKRSRRRIQLRKLAAI